MVDWFGLHECSGNCTGEKCQSNKVVSGGHGLLPVKVLSGIGQCQSSKVVSGGHGLLPVKVLSGVGQCQSSKVVSGGHGLVACQPRQRVVAMGY